MPIGPLTRRSLKSWVEVKPELLVAVDIGTTYSAVSLCIRTYGPNGSSNVEVITSWPKQALKNIKEPSVVCYDLDGTLNPEGFGSGAFDDADVVDQIDQGKLIKVQWWKLAFRPDHLPPIAGLEDYLPDFNKGLNINVETVLRDYLMYVQNRVQTHLTEAHANGARLWQELQPDLKLILTTPNGWEGRNQNAMREVAIQAGFVREKAQVKFFDEAEAAILHTIETGRLVNWVQLGQYIAMCDCGGGTIDITPYKVVLLEPLRLEEVSYPRCYIAGSIFINEQARPWIRDHLCGTDHCVQRAMDNFEKQTKRTFDGTRSFSTVELGGTKSDEQRHIHRGRLRIPTEKMVEWFEPSLQAIIQGLSEVVHLDVKKIVLGGGFANSPYLMKKVLEWAVAEGVEVARPTDPLEKAVTNGGLSYYVNSIIVKRVAKFHYGIDANMEYQPHNAEFQGRSTYVDPAGVRRVDGGFSCVVEKNRNICPDEEVTMWFHRPCKDGDELTVELDLWAYRWANPPMFIRSRGSDKVYVGFFRICTIRADLPKGFYDALPYEPCRRGGKKFKYLEYQVAILLGETEVRGWLRWRDPSDNKKKLSEGPVSIGYD